MAIAHIAVAYDSTESAATVAGRIARPAADASPAIQRCSAELAGVAGGLRRAAVSVVVETGDETKPSATITVGGANLTADDTIAIGPVTLTWKASPSGEDQVAFVNTAATDATALAAAINAHSDLSGMVTAAAASAVVTVTGALPGNVCRYTVVKSETNSGAMALSAASLGGVTSAVQSTPRTHSMGV